MNLLLLGNQSLIDVFPGLGPFFQIREFILLELQVQGVVLVAQLLGHLLNLFLDGQFLLAQRHNLLLYLIPRGFRCLDVLIGFECLLQQGYRLAHGVKLLHGAFGGDHLGLRLLLQGLVSLVATVVDSLLQRLLLRLQRGGITGLHLLAGCQNLFVSLRPLLQFADAELVGGHSVIGIGEQRTGQFLGGFTQGRNHALERSQELRLLLSRLVLV